MLFVVGEWRTFFISAVASFRNYSAAALEDIIVVSQCSEILLKVALAFSNSLPFYLSTLLSLNAFLRLTLAGVVLSRRRQDQHGRSSCSTWAPSDLHLRSHSSQYHHTGRRERCSVVKVSAACRA
ncbi:hypothetical protein NQZ68_027819 [Dissostichus eleginoides]|nr:hypothetical protein NQZ68_027819 [Dissostichus eleginoides]